MSDVVRRSAGASIEDLISWLKLFVCGAKFNIANKPSRIVVKFIFFNNKLEFFLNVYINKSLSYYIYIYKHNFIS